MRNQILLDLVKLDIYLNPGIDVTRPVENIPPHEAKQLYFLWINTRNQILKTGNPDAQNALDQFRSLIARVTGKYGQVLEMECGRAILYSYQYDNNPTILQNFLDSRDPNGAKFCATEFNNMPLQQLKDMLDNFYSSRGYQRTGNSYLDLLYQNVCKRLGHNNYNVSNMPKQPYYQQPQDKYQPNPSPRNHYQKNSFLNQYKQYQQYQQDNRNNNNTTCQTFIECVIGCWKKTRNQNKFKY